MDFDAYGHLMDRLFLQELEAAMMLTPAERDMSELRSTEYQRQWEQYKHRMFLKNGLDGGPSPAVIMDEPFVPIGDF